MLSVVAFWALGLWLAGRLARRWAGRMDLRRGSLILFRLEQRYIFLLICGIVLWIVGILTGGEKYALYAAGPILTVFAIACFLEGLAVILFYLALWRTTAAPVPYRLLAIMAMIAALFLTFISLLGCMLLGLSDIWFDYRRLKAVEERLGLDR
jgi:vacuolar-type H+-ATPase subunit I/STV1